MHVATDMMWKRAVRAGLLMARTVAIGGTFALAASLAARSDPAHAAAHQACLQVRRAGSRGFGLRRCMVFNPS